MMLPDGLIFDLQQSETGESLSITTTTMPPIPLADPDAADSDQQFGFVDKVHKAIFICP